MSWDDSDDYKNDYKNKNKNCDRNENNVNVDIGNGGDDDCNGWKDMVWVVRTA